MAQKSRIMYTETKSIKAWKDSDGIGYVEFQPKTDFGSYELREYYNICKKQSGGKPTPVIMNITHANLRDIIVTAMLNKKFLEFTKAVAFIGWPRALHTQLLANFLLKINTNPFPLKKFKNEKEAKDWIMQFVDTKKKK